MDDLISRQAAIEALDCINGTEEVLRSLPSAQINWIVNNDIHLCDSCKYSYPSCPSSKFDVVFGDSIGHDNICACNKYQPRYDEEWRKMHYKSSYSQGFLEGVRMCEQPTVQPEKTQHYQEGTTSDLISRQAAIDALWKALYEYEDKTEKQFQESEDLDVGDWIERRIFVQNMNDIDRQTILNLPSAQPEPRWIPCSERLPEIKQHVLLSCYGRVIYGRMISKDGNGGYPVFEICDSVGEKRPIVLETTVHSKFTTSRIIAWMPLPEPYKGGEQDG